MQYSATLWIQIDLADDDVNGYGEPVPAESV